MAAINTPESTFQADPTIGASDLRAASNSESPRVGGAYLERVWDWRKQIQAADRPITVPSTHDTRESANTSASDRKTLFVWPMPGPKGYALCFRGFKPESAIEFDIGNHCERAIEEWSLDHHVLTFPFRRDIPPFDSKQRVMIERHKSLLFFDFESTTAHFVDEPATISDGLSTKHSATMTQSTPVFTCGAATILEQARDIASRSERPFQGATTPIEVWTHISLWLVGFAEETPFARYHYLSGKLEANVTGCRELDSVLSDQFSSKTGRDNLAHKQFREHVMAHSDFLLDYYVRPTLESGNPPPDDEALSTWCHTLRMAVALEGLDRTSTEVEAMERHFRYSDLELRLENDPILVVVDGAIMLSADSFFAGLSVPASKRAHIAYNPFFNSLGTGPTAFQLPVLIIKHQTEGSELTNGTSNVQRICICSAVYFLKTLGIQDFPVYGLATCGNRAFLSQAWYSREDDCCYVLDRGIRGEAFDLATEEGNRRFIGFRAQLRRHAKSLEQHLDSNRRDIEAYLAAAEDSVFHWSKTSQVRRLRKREKGGSK